MKCSELLSRGKQCFEEQDYDEAFAIFKKGMEQGDSYCTYMMAECYRIAFHRNNLSDIDKVYAWEYALNAIELYERAYSIEKNPVFLVHEYFVKYILYRPKKTSSYYERTMEIISYCAGESRVTDDDAFNFLLAVKADDYQELCKYIADEKHEEYLRISACMEIYRRHTNRNGARAMAALETANRIRACFNQEALDDDLEEEEPEYPEVMEKVIMDIEDEPIDYGEYDSYEEFPSDDGPDDLYDYYYNDDYDGWDYDDY